MFYRELRLPQTLTVDEMRAVLGHVSSATTAAPTLRLGRAGLPGPGLASSPTVRRACTTTRSSQRLFTWYAKALPALSRRPSRGSAGAGGSDHVSRFCHRRSGRRWPGALRKIHATATGWDLYVNNYLSLAGRGGARPASVSAAFHALMSDPERQAEIAKLGEQPEEVSPYDSHPSLSERLAAVERLPEPQHAAGPALGPDAARGRQRGGAGGGAVDVEPGGPDRAAAGVSWEELISHGHVRVRRNADAVRRPGRGRAAGDGVAARPYLGRGVRGHRAGGGRPSCARPSCWKQGWETRRPRCWPVVLGQAREAVLITARRGQVDRCRGPGPRGCCSTTGEEVLALWIFLSTPAQVCGQPRGVWRAVAAVAGRSRHAPRTTCRWRSPARPRWDSRQVGGLRSSTGSAASIQHCFQRLSFQHVAVFRDPVVGGPTLTPRRRPRASLTASCAIPASWSASMPRRHRSCHHSTRVHHLAALRQT
ncbi:hypothetical protein [Nonomuraea rubra]|uniref:hypothetical protein n=1 Tax=Nonomuraea rubra TaxID=46180 RepID=UPI0031F05AB2